MKKFIITAAIMIIFSFSSIGNAEIIEMFFEDDNGGHQSLEFDDTLSFKDAYNAKFGDVKIFNGGRLFELNAPDTQATSSEYNSGVFSFHDDCNEGNLEFSNATIMADSIADLGYAITTNIIPDSLATIFDSMVGVDDFFFCMFSSSEASGLDEYMGDTTLKSWGYKTSPVPIPPTILLFGSSLIGGWPVYIDIKRFK